MMTSQTPHPVTSPVVRNVQSLSNRQNYQKRGPLGNSLLSPAKRGVHVQAGERDFSHRGSSVASTIHGQNSTPSSTLNNSRVANITQQVTSTRSTTQRWSIITPTATPGTSSLTSPAPSGITQTDSLRRVVSSPASGIASTPTPLSVLENRPAPIQNPDAYVIITNPLRTGPTVRNLSQRQWQLQLQAVSTPRSVASSCHSMHRSGHFDMMCLVFATAWLLKLYMCNRLPFMSARDLETVSCVMRRVAKALAEASHW
jgi:hypothetical protein